MLRYLLAGLILLHGLIHWMGFAKAFGYADIKNITGQISKTTGTIWLTAALLLMTASVLLFSQRNSWWVIAMAGIILSQAAITQSWHDARFGTIANGIILIAVVFGWGSSRFESSFQKDVAQQLARQSAGKPELLMETDLAALPPPVSKYLRYCGVVGKPKLKNMRVAFTGEMRDKGKDYFPFHSVQYNFFDQPTRLFYMKARMKGLTVPGYHRYRDAKASMDIRLFGLFPVVQA